MAKKSQHSFDKRQKELKRLQKAKEKMERRQGKKKEAPSDEPQVSGQDSQTSEN